MKAVVFERFGEPAEVLHVAEVPAPTEPGKNEVRVRMIASPINPSDLLTVRGQYGRLPKLPMSPGYEGVGVIDAVGPGLLRVIRGLRPGRRVAVINAQGGNWAELVTVSARHVVPLPDDIPDDQGASFFVNPATVLVMVERVLQVRRGEWLLQTAAASALGRMVIRLARHAGFRTINLVRRPEQAEELKGLGADAAFATESGPVVDQVRQLAGDDVRHALDCVGGSMGLEALRCLGPNGRMLVYGTLSGEPIPVDPRLLIGGQKSIEGFWLSEWAKAQGALTMLKLFRRIIRMLRDGVLTTNVQARFKLADVASAVREAEKPGRKGKILLECK